MDVISSSLIATTILGAAVVQLVRMPPCHGGGQGFKSPSGRHFYASVAQLVEQGTENPRVSGSIPL